jgi:hypothetical protein
LTPAPRLLRLRRRRDGILTPADHHDPAALGAIPEQRPPEALEVGWGLGTLTMALMTKTMPYKHHIGRSRLSSPEEAANDTGDTGEGTDHGDPISDRILVADVPGREARLELLHQHHHI